MNGALHFARRPGRRALRCLVVLWLLGPAAAVAQSPEDEWGAYPGADPQEEFVLPSTLPSSPPAPAPVELLPTRRPQPPPPARSAVRRRPVQPPNTVSMLGAPMLGQWKRGQAFLLGFPWISVRASIGLLDSLEAGLGYDTYYFAMNELRVRFKYGALWVDAWSLAATLEGGAALFGERAAAEQRGARWITGRRNFNLSPALVASYQGQHARAARLFVELRYTLAFDTEPFATGPLQGRPPPVVLGHNVLVQIGAELPLSVTTSFVFLLGLDFHGRDVDSVLMPVCSVGLVTGL